MLAAILRWLCGFIQKVGRLINPRSRGSRPTRLDVFLVIAPENGPSQPPKRKGNDSSKLTVPSIFRCVLMLVSGKTADSTVFFYPSKTTALNRASLWAAAGFVLDLVQDIRGVNDQAIFATRNKGL